MRDETTIDDIRIIEIEKESQRIANPQEVAALEDAIAHPYDLESLATLHAENTWHFKCCDVKARSTTCTGHVLEARDKELEPDEQHATLTNFLESDNEDGDFCEDVLYKFATDYEALGNAYLEVDRSKDGKLAGLYHLPGYTIHKSAKHPGYWQIRSEKRKYFKLFGDDEDNFTNNQQAVNEIIHLKSYFLRSDFYGMPDFLPSLSAAVLDALAANFNMDFFENSAIPAMALIIEGGKLGEKAQETVKRFFEGQIKGSKNFHRTLYMPVDREGVKARFEKLMTEVKEASFMNLRNANRDEIVAAHGVPPRLVGIVSSGQLGGSSEAFAQMKMFKELIIEPRQRRIERLLTRLFKLTLGIDKWRFRFNRLEIEEPNKRADYLNKLTGGIPLLTEDEGRAELGREPVKRDENDPDLGELAKQVSTLKELIEKAL